VKFREPLRDLPCRVAAVSPGELGPAEQRPAEWQVRSADGERPNRLECFSGSDALVRSLRYAHEEYSRVRWFVS
jgi:hypothetical protein